jgi:hypothetical protein
VASVSLAAETLAPLKTRECAQLMTALGALARVLAISEPEHLFAPRVKRR